MCSMAKKLYLKGYVSFNNYFSKLVVSWAGTSWGWNHQKAAVSVGSNKKIHTWILNPSNLLSVRLWQQDGLDLSPVFWPLLCDNDDDWAELLLAPLPLRRHFESTPAVTSIWGPRVSSVMCDFDNSLAVCSVVEWIKLKWNTQLWFFSCIRI